MAIPTKTSTPRNHNVFKMDNDSATIGIDNRCSLWISHIAEAFIGELRESRRKIRGFGGVIQPKIKTGTLLWRWEDDQGQEHKILIPIPSLFHQESVGSSVHNIGHKPGDIIKS